MEAAQETLTLFFLNEQHNLHIDYLTATKTICTRISIISERLKKENRTQQDHYTYHSQLDDLFPFGYLLLLFFSG